MRAGSEVGRAMRSAIGGCSSVGRAIALQAIGHRFDSVHLHHGTERPGRERVPRGGDSIVFF